MFVYTIRYNQVFQQNCHTLIPNSHYILNIPPFTINFAKTKQANRKILNFYFASSHFRH